MIRFACALFAAAVLGLPAAAQQVAVSAHTLDNGMKILIQEDHDIPNVAMYLFYRVGSRNERPGITGISHFFEHMMFNGAKKYGRSNSIEMEESGGSNNAYTSSDVTVYTNWFPARRSTADVRHGSRSHPEPRVRSEDDRERARRGAFRAAAARRQQQLRTLYRTAQRYRLSGASLSVPVIGWASDIKAWTMDDLKATSNGLRAE